MTQAEHDRWQERYGAPGYLFGTAPNTFVKSQASLLRKGQKALAIADGEGRNGVFLAEQGLDVLSLDFSPNAQAKARKLAAERGVTLRVEQADVINWPYPADSFDVVAAIFFQFATPDERETIFAGIKRTLKKGGLLLLEGYTPKQLDYKTGGPSKIENLYTRDLLQKAFGDFSKLDIREYDAEIHEGAGHGGMSALIDVVAVK
ncbi:methyltransferase domain-containing protein [Microbacteriaceae bacterium K1510]|nr:methyltransferase domain-containing protein [Microbacteriaceae bacterium K1510]